MTRTRLPLIVAACLIVASPAAIGDRNNSDVQQARDHAQEVQRIKQNAEEHGTKGHKSDHGKMHQDPMERARERNRKLKEEEETEEDLDNSDEQ